MASFLLLIAGVDQYVASIKTQQQYNASLYGIKKSFYHIS